jgi:mono/diheme cytochrome c family protein
MRRALIMTAGIVAVAGQPCAVAANDSESAETRGAAVFAHYCVLCHGPAGKGDGRAATMQKVPPADLSASVRSAEFKRQIVLEGGAAVARSSSMPAWGDVLTVQQVEDLVVFLEALVHSVPTTGTRTARDSFVLPSEVKRP